MRLGIDTGSYRNHRLATNVQGQPEPIVGMGVTMLHWTDRSAGTIQRVFKIGKATAIECTRDTAVRIDKNGMSESQEYRYSTRPDGDRSTYRQGANGMWVHVRINSETGRWKKSDGGGGLRLGVREAFNDFSF